MSDKIKIFTISDHPLSPSGVGTQTKYIIEGLLKTGKYQFVSFGGAIKHNSHQPQKTEQWGEDWVIWPVDGYGNPDILILGLTYPTIALMIMSHVSQNLPTTYFRPSLRRQTLHISHTRLMKIFLSHYPKKKLEVLKKLKI